MPNFYSKYQNAKFDGAKWPTINIFYRIDNREFWIYMLFKAF